MILQRAGKTWPVDTNRMSQSPHSPLQDTTKAALVHDILLHIIRIHRLSHLQFHCGAQVLLAVFVSNTTEFTCLNYYHIEQVETKHCQRGCSSRGTSLAWEESCLAHWGAGSHQKGWAKTSWLIPGTEWAWVIKYIFINERAKPLSSSSATATPVWMLSSTLAGTYFGN